jgi:hypothetical protein
MDPLSILNLAKNRFNKPGYIKFNLIQEEGTFSILKNQSYYVVQWFPQILYLK